MRHTNHECKTKQGRGTRQHSLTHTHAHTHTHTHEQPHRQSHTPTARLATGGDRFRCALFSGVGPLFCRCGAGVGGVELRQGHAELGVRVVGVGREGNGTRLGRPEASGGLTQRRRKGFVLSGGKEADL